MNALIYLLIGACVTQVAWAQFSEMPGISSAFQKDYTDAQRQAAADMSAKPLFSLLDRYGSHSERAEIYLSIGMLYNQTAGLVDHEQAILYFTESLEYDLPETIRLRTILLRGNSQEQVERHEAALADYLRGLLLTTYYNFDGSWPDILDPKAELSNAKSEKEVQKLRDYGIYRMRVDRHRRLLMSRYFLVDAAKRILEKPEFKKFDFAALFSEICPEPSKFDEIKRLLDSENKRPWP